MPGQLRVSFEERRRADECSLEPIRIPGAVQPHGALVAVDSLTWQIVSVSENTIRHFGTDASALLGEHLSALSGPGPLAQFADVLDPASTAANPVRIDVDGKSFDVILNRSGPQYLLDFEPTLPTVESEAVTAIFAAIHRLSGITTVDRLWAETARELYRITRYDRVMIYHFHPDAHGEVVAEVVADDMDPYLGLHYPASDIPSQARELYLLKLSRVIADSSVESSALTSSAAVNGHPAVGIDLSLAELRSVSPHHLEFMRNMGQASTMSFSLIHEGQLIGMITCAHRTPRRVAFAVRQGLEILAAQVALQLSSIRALQQVNKQLELRTIRARIVDGLLGDVDISSELLGGLASMLDLIPADGATVRLSGVIASVGLVPSGANQQILAEQLWDSAAGLNLATDSVLLDHPAYASLLPDLAGALIVPIGSDGDYIAWFRAEKLHSVSWLGDLSPSNRETLLSPRNSFDAWSRDVTGVAESWHDFEAEGNELGRDIERVLFRRTESRLALVAQLDPLTGLPNRRRLLDRLEHAFARYERGDQLSVLFIDLDGLKLVNDSLGHDAGDTVLVRAARQLLSVARAQDTVARIGGDEFVIVCEGTTATQAEGIAARVVGAIRTSLPGVEADASVTISASVGIGDAEFAIDAADLLKQADSAMYRAKIAGRDRFSH